MPVRSRLSGYRAAACLLLAGLVSACGQQIALPPAEVAGQPNSAPTTTASVPKPIEAGVSDASFTVGSNATDTYAAVARGALNCWFGANGPMKRSHIFHADANPPAKGGSAEIVLQERDASLSDQRGVKAFRVAFIPTGDGTQVTVSHLKVDPNVALALTRDVETWARGQAGCQLRTVLDPVPDPVPQPKVARIRTTR
ncbi:MAG: hypothetical protein EKK41_09365 [Hyphomicrobiales bacterium]|nr:MAG: hypothetical protein EKK41_09365 [Hyphomicrobiales bacterium]